MRLISLKKDNYLIICNLVKEIVKLNAFESFNDFNLFMVDDGKKIRMFSLIYNDEDKECGITFYTKPEELNSAHDIFSFDPSTMNFEYNSKNVILTNKENLDSDDIKYFKKNEIKIKKKNNVVVRTFVSGISTYISTNQEASDIIELLSCLVVLLRNDFDLLKEGFASKKMAFMELNHRRKVYAVHMISVPYLEKKYEYTIPTNDEINEFVGFERNDNDCYLLSKNLDVNVKSKSCNIALNPLFVMYSSEDDLYNCEILVSLPNEYSNLMISVLKDFFKKDGIPKSLVINSRKLYYGLYNLLDSLGIDVKLQVDNNTKNNFLTKVNEAISGFFSMFIENVFSEDEFVEMASFIKQAIAYADGDEMLFSEEQLEMFSNIIGDEDDEIYYDEDDYEDEDVLKDLIS